tara:strand:- start:1360 stop:2487 length:1128 start_codon:yes stop_codon:yes gene_type:complete
MRTQYAVFIFRERSTERTARCEYMQIMLSRLQHDLFNQLMTEVEKSGSCRAEVLRHATDRGWSDSISNRPSFTGKDSLTLLESAMAVTGDKSLPTKLGHSVGIESYGVFGFALMTCPNLRTSNRLLMRYSGIFSNLSWISYETDAALVLRLNLDVGSAELCVPAAELCFAQLYKIGSSLYGGAVPDAKIELCFPKPAHAGCYRYGRSTEVRFNSQFNQVVIPTKALDTPVRSADSTRHILFSQQCEAMLYGVNDTRKTAAAVRKLLMLSAGAFLGISDIANKLNLSERTLRRHLLEEDTNFRQILEEVRNLLAREYLTKTTMPVAEIAHLLEYSETSNFRRAFFRWNELTPHNYRLQQSPQQTLSSMTGNDLPVL